MPAAAASQLVQAAGGSTQPASQGQVQQGVEMLGPSEFRRLFICGHRLHAECSKKASNKTPRPHWFHAECSKTAFNKALRPHWFHPKT